MTQTKKRIIFVEPNHGHEEVLYPWIELLHKEFSLSVVAPASLFDVDLLEATRHMYDALPYSREKRPANRIVRALGMVKKYIRIRQSVDSVEASPIIFNSVPSVVDAIVIAILFRGYKKIQVIHNFQIYLSRIGKLVYRFFDGNIVISEDVYSFVRVHHPDFDKLDFVLPIFFDTFLSLQGSETTEKVDRNLVNIGVFGTVDEHRRNYRGLLRAIKQWGSVGECQIKVYVVGKSPESFIGQVESEGVGAFIRVYDDFVPFRDLFNLLREMDLICFLIDDSVVYAPHYNRYKISGTSNLLKAFGITGISSADFPVDESLRDNCYFYTGDDIGSVIKQINEGFITKETICLKREAHHRQQVLSFENNQLRLMKLLESI